MLGKLAKWLRIIGYDTLFVSIPQNKLFGISKSEERIFLTRDTRLLKTRDFYKGKIRYIFIKNDYFREQIMQVVNELKLPKFIKSPFCII
ncbi:MAG: hypothetical protein KAS39_06430, partial [Actinomycetia bacterium]|nr:hypothetical protein [Actinomycetes bacterium]